LLLNLRVVGVIAQSLDDGINAPLLGDFYLVAVIPGKVRQRPATTPLNLRVIGVIAQSLDDGINAALLGDFHDRKRVQGWQSCIQHSCAHDELSELEGLGQHTLDCAYHPREDTNRQVPQPFRNNKHRNDDGDDRIRGVVRQHRLRNVCRDRIASRANSQRTCARCCDQPL